MNKLKPFQKLRILLLVVSLIIIYAATVQAAVFDFNADSKADILWQNTTTGQVVIWLMNGTARSSSGSPGTVAAPWQIKGVGDFNGDSKADILWQNTTTGQVVIWLMNGTARSSSGYSGTVAAPWQIKPSESDTTLPTVTITSPTPNPTYSTCSSSSINLSGSASDNVGVTQVTWSNNRGGSRSCSGTTSWSCSGITLYSGDNIITVTARDAANNQKTDTLTVTYTTFAGNWSGTWISDYYAGPGDSGAVSSSITQGGATLSGTMTITNIGDCNDTVSNASITDSVVSGCTAEFVISGIACGVPGAVYVYDCTVTNNTMTGSYSTYYYEGGQWWWEDDGTFSLTR